jgi:G3E family GTPase
MLKAMIRKLNADAKIISAVKGNVELNEILNTGLFDFEKTSQSAGWIEELNNTHIPETEEYGISSFVFRDKKPFHPERFWNYLNTEWHSNIIRSKGIFWLASRMDEALNWSQAGGSLKADKAGVWWCSMPFSERIRYEAFIENQSLIEKDWDKRFGDRHNELVIIGQEMKRDEIIFELMNCLCTETEIQQMENGFIFNDSFPL